MEEKVIDAARGHDHRAWLGAMEKIAKEPRKAFRFAVGKNAFRPGDTEMRQTTPVAMNPAERHL